MSESTRTKPMFRTHSPTCVCALCNPDDYEDLWDEEEEEHARNTLRTRTERLRIKVEPR